MSMALRLQWKPSFSLWSYRLSGNFILICMSEIFSDFETWHKKPRNKIRSKRSKWSALKLRYIQYSFFVFSRSVKKLFSIDFSQLIFSNWFLKCHYLYFLNFFHNKFYLVEKCNITAHCLYRTLFIPCFKVKSKVFRQKHFFIILAFELLRSFSRNVYN